MREAANALSVIGSTLRVRAGETLFVEGDSAGKCYVVVSGLLKEFNTLKDGSCHISDLRFPGVLVGLTPAPAYHQTAEAIQETCLTSYPVERFRMIVAGNPVLSDWLARTLLGDLERTRTNGLALSRLSAMERVARFLLTLRRLTGSSSDLGGAHPIPMSRQDMADHLGLTIETVCRCLTTLKGKGLITMITAHGFTVANETAIAALAEHEDRDGDGRNGR